MFNPDDYLNRLYEKAPMTYAFTATDKLEWLEWHQKTKLAFISRLGIPSVTKSALKPQLLEEKVMDGYTRQRISYETDEGLVVPAYILLPEGGKDSYPTVIACHGHGYGSREVVGLRPDGSENLGDPGYQKNFGVELVKRGYIVIVPELLGFGDRRLIEDHGKPLEESSCHRISDNLLMLGKTMAGLRVWDIVRTIDYLLTRDDVDKDRIGTMGISGGGLVSAFASVVDPRIRVSVISGYTNTFKKSVMAMPHCIDNFVPGLLEVGEMVDIISLIAPHPLLIEAGRQDEIFPLSGTLEAYKGLENVYELLGEAPRLALDLFEGGHQISGQKAYDWFDHWL